MSKPHPLEILKYKVYMMKNETFTDTKNSLRSQIDDYKESKGSFSNFLGIPTILISERFQEQLAYIIKEIEIEDQKAAKEFKLYLDTIIINMHTKISKYKKSPYLDIEEIKEIENQGYFIPFYIDTKNDKYVILDILKR